MDRLKGYKTAEIAQLLSINENTVRTQLKRAKSPSEDEDNGGVG
ncbi:sigma factor-like helix-turn-helix DNA-binding protein [Paenibacillus rhizoplanae]